MTIASELTKLQNNLSDSYTAVSNKGGTIPQNQCFDNLPTAINSITTGIIPSGTINITTNNTYDVTNYASAVVNVDTVNNTNLSVTPLTTAQSFTVSAPYTGYYTVSVSAVTSSIDSNIKASNIKSGISILGVNGSVVELNADSVTINPSTSSQTITPTSPVNGFDEITVNPVTSSIDANITAGNIKSGISILGVSGTVTELNGSSRSVTLTSASGQTFNPETGKNGITSITVTPNNQARTVTPSTSQQTLSVNTGYSGNGTITVNAVTSAIDSDIKATNIKSGVNILGVNGSVVELAGETRTVSITSTAGNTFTPSSGKNGITSITVTPTNQAKTITPTTSSQSISVPSGYSGFGALTVNAVTSSIDANIIASNIKKGVTILGITGTFEGFANYFIDANGNTQSLSKGSYTLNAIDTSITQANVLQEAYKGSTNVIEVHIDKVETISGGTSLGDAFRQSTIEILSFDSLKTISGSSALSQICRQCLALVSIKFDSLKEITALKALWQAFLNCTALATNINFNSLEEISGSQALQSAFSGCTGLNNKSLSFPALKSTSFGSNTNQFNYMIRYVTGCTVHFPSNLQSVIGSWSDVTSGFGGTNTTVLFDLPATT